MSVKHVIRIAAIIGVGVLLTGCGGGNSDAKFKAYADKKGMTGVEAAAFMVCAKDLTSNKPKFPVSDGNLVMKEVPLDICACHVKAITDVFNDNQYKGFAAFASYMAKEVKKKPPRFSKKSLKPDIKSADAAAELENTLTSCVYSYRNDHQEQSAKLFEVVPVKVPVKNDKTASNSSS